MTKITLSLPPEVEKELRRRAKKDGVRGALSLITARANIMGIALMNQL